MKITTIFFFFLLIINYNNVKFVVYCAGGANYGDVVISTAITTMIKEPLTLVSKDLYDHAVKSPIEGLISRIKKVVRYRKVLRWSRIWWVLLVREIVGDGEIEEKTEELLRDIWDQCTISVYNNTLYTVESKPALFLHGILSECKENYSTKLKHDPGLIVAKIDQIIKSQIYRFWISAPYMKIGKSGIFYTRVNQKIVPKLPDRCTLKHLTSYMEDKLKSIDNKKNMDSSKFSFSVSSDTNS
ncbi:exported protein 2, putative [Hepatocystis sp. ex Piliocolobus tephrosceles]|nr:exported protein 2, putative [Hepatocystis sp. ex Piliocolobus tephrosceles]